VNKGGNGLDLVAEETLSDPEIDDRGRATATLTLIGFFSTTYMWVFMTLRGMVEADSVVASGKNESR